MSRPSPYALAALILAGLAAWSSIARPTAGQPVAVPVATSRYAISAIPAGPGSFSSVFITDTTSGQTWRRYEVRDATWVDLGSPIPPR